MTTFNKLTANMVYTLLVATRLIGLITNRCSGKESALLPRILLWEYNAGEYHQKEKNVIYT